MEGISARSRRASRTRFSVCAVLSLIATSVVAGWFAPQGATHPYAPSVHPTVPLGSAAPATHSAAFCPKKGGTMVVALPGDIATTDPVLVNDSNSAYVLHNVLEGLMGFRPGTISNPIPVLAAKVPVVSKDGMSYTFSLRRNVKFQDGTPFNAAAVQYNFRRWLNMPPSLQPYAVYVGNVFGFGQQGLIRRIRILDPYTVRFRLRRPNSSFLTYLTLPYFAISSPTALKAGGADNSITTPTQIPYGRGGPTAATGTGPFRFKEWVPGDHVAIERNPSYWDST